MTDAPTWRTYVEAMVDKAQAHQDELFYRLALAGWQAELKRIKHDAAHMGNTSELPGRILPDLRRRPR